MAFKDASMAPDEKRSANAIARRNRQIGLGLRSEPDPRPVCPIVLFTHYSDSGPCEPGSPSAFCPHCGSGGRYVWSFICQDGSRRGAMKGCVKLFFASKLAAQQMASLERFRDDSAAFAAGRRKWGPASWDVEIFKATEALHHGEIGVEEAKDIINASLYKRGTFLARKRR